MNSPRSVLPALALLASLASSGAAQSPSARALSADSALARELRARVDAGRAPGMVVGILEGGATRVIAVGTTEREGGRPVDAATVFEIGSITKVFTGTLLADMTARREVWLEQPVEALLPVGVRIPVRGEKITLLDLATHMSGLPRLPGNMRPRDWRNPYADYTEELLYDFLSEQRPSRAPGVQFEYSNLGVGLLGHVLARRAGAGWEAVVVERIIEPLGMRDTRVGLTPAMRARLAAGHDGLARPVSNWDLPGLVGAGGLRSTAGDMLRFARAVMDTATAPASLGAALADASRPRREVRERQAVGLGWFVQRWSDREILWHNGGTGGYRSFLAIDRKGGRTIVVLANSTVDVDPVGWEWLEGKVREEWEHSANGGR